MEKKISERYADFVLAGLVLYTVVLVFATLDEILGWNILAPYF